MKADREYESVTIDKIETHADGYTLVRSDGFCFMCPLIPDGYIPVVGDEARFYGQGIDLPVRGLVINGHTAFYRTPEEQEAKHREEREADGCAPLDDEPLRLIRRLAARLRTALADVARLTEENAALRSEVEAIGASYDRARLAAEQALEANAVLKEAVISISRTANKARAAPAAAEQEKEKAVAEERERIKVEFLEKIAGPLLSAFATRLRCPDGSVLIRLEHEPEALAAIEAELAAIRARAGRNDG